MINYPDVLLKCLVLHYFLCSTIENKLTIFPVRVKFIFQSDILFHTHHSYVYVYIYYFNWTCNDIVVVQLLSCVWLFVTHRLQPARLPCPSWHPRVCSNLCPYLTIPTSVVSFFCFNLSQHQSLFQWVGSSHHSIGVSAAVLPMNIQG